jgi:hypothetical protein
VPAARCRMSRPLLGMAHTRLKRVAALVFALKVFQRQLLPMLPMLPQISPSLSAFTFF